MPDAPMKKVQIMSSLVSSVFCACGVLPFDNVKTKLQNQKRDPTTGEKPYKGIAHCFMKTAAREGPVGLWAGLPTFYFRVGPHAVITLLTAE